MQKSIPVYLDESSWFLIMVTKNQTIGDIKKVFEKHPDLRLKMFVNNNEYPVMETSQYNDNFIEPLWNDQIQIVATRKHIERIWSKDPNVDKLILMNLNPQELLSTCLTNNYVANLCRDKYFFQRKLQKDYPTIDISRVKAFKDLYIYLARRPKMGQEMGDLVMGDDNTTLLLIGENGKRHSLITRDQSITFPYYVSPYYFSQFDNYVDISFEGIEDFIKNRQGNTSSITGRFNEKYKLIITGLEELHENVIKESLKFIVENPFEPERAEFIGGILYIPAASLGL